MTDNDIIKALWCCANNPNECVCYENKCPLFGQKCIDILSKNALDLINRLQAEIERLWNDCDYFEEKAKIAKTEAVKEFAERLKDLTLPILIGGKYDYEVISKQGIDHALKEMVGEDNA